MKAVLVHPHDLWRDPWTIRILALARGLQQRGHEVALCHMPRKEAPKHAPLRAPSPDDPPIYEFKPRQQHALSNYRLLLELCANCDVIHLQKCFPASALPVLWAARALNKPIHYDWDDDETAISRLVEKRGLARFHLASYETQLPQFARTLTYASRALHDRAAALGFAEERMFHLPVGADLERFHPHCGDADALRDFGLDPDKPTVLYVGQLEGAAHPHWLVDAAPKVIEQAPDVQFLFVGGGEQLEDLQAHVNASPARDAICVGGYIPHDRVPALVGCAAVCVACFDDDPATRAKSPLKIAEYLAAGRAIVVSDVGDAPWMVENCGIAVTPESIPALAEGITTYLNDPSKREADGRLARQRAERLFNWERGVDTLIQAYEHCLENTFA
ncbi:glycosyltransferase family 4 protein [bacterium]|nr:glycosyltransferase family 4 protein [bacterium]